MKKLISVFILAALLLTLLFSGCGSGPDTGGGLTDGDGGPAFSQAPLSADISDPMVIAAMEILSPFSGADVKPENFYFIDFNLDGTAELVIDFPSEAVNYCIGSVYSWVNGEFVLVSNEYKDQFTSLYYDAADSEYIFISCVTEQINDVTTMTVFSRQTFDGQAFGYQGLFACEATVGEEEMIRVCYANDGSDPAKDILDCPVDTDTYDQMFGDYFFSLEEYRMELTNVSYADWIASGSNAQAYSIANSISGFSYYGMSRFLMDEVEMGEGDMGY